MRNEPLDHPSLGEYLRTAREQAGYSIRELAGRVGIHFSYLARLESGETAHPSPELLQRLSEELGLELTELLAYVGVKPDKALPEPRMYFRRKLGVDAEEAEVLARLIEDYQAGKLAKRAVKKQGNKKGGDDENTN